MRDHVPPLLTAAEVAERFGVDRSWVYAHARELGVVQLGAGPRPRLRFDPAVIAQLLTPRASTVVPGTARLLPIRTSRRYTRRRTLGGEDARATH